jgi:nitrate reductase delta subunit
MDENADARGALTPVLEPGTESERLAGVKSSRLRVGAFSRVGPSVEACARVRAWTRARFELPDDATVLVSQVACSRPGCPPLETVIAFWSEGEARRHFKIFKPVGAVVLDDYPPAWLKDALCASDAPDFECC